MNAILFAILFSAVFTIGAGNAALAQGYPNKAIRFVVPFVPGGGTDLMARSIGQRLNEAWGQPVVVDHRPGGTGAVASVIVAQSAADGYTLLMVTSSTHAISPNLFRKPPYNPVRDFAAVARTATAPQILAVHPSVPVNSVKELIALAKAKPGALNYASPGTGTIGHMTGEMFKLVAGVDVMHIPYKGSASAARELLGGQVQFSFSAPGPIIPQVRAGKLKVLAAATRERSPQLADIPTFAELGYPAIEASNWYGVVTTAGAPKAVVEKLNREIVRIVRLPEMKEIFFRQGYEQKTSTPGEFAQFIKDELAKWQKVTKASGVRID